ncbi:MAG: hypothetical protein HGJ93_04435 [Desulfosarcina sp.]|nr:hypothetical protein [Desulfosarcina sp.]MBC2765217.1 hypothetical protein [Desulfosarcina sp.]
MIKYREKIGALLASFALNLKRYKNAAFIFIKGKKDDIKSSTSSSIQLVPSVIKKPSVVWRWLFTSYWFYFSLIIAVILMNTVVGAAIDKSLTKIYPTIKTEKFFGLVVQEQNDPRIEWQRKLIRGVLWVGACGLNAYVLLLCLPGIVRKTTRKARKNEAKADAIVTEKPSESILLYSKALKLAVGQSHESCLKSKIDTLDDAFRSGKIERSSPMSSTTPEPKGTGTLVLPKNEFPNHSKQENVIGPDGRYRIERGGTGTCSA